MAHGGEGHLTASPQFVPRPSGEQRSMRARALCSRLIRRRVPGVSYVAVALVTGSGGLIGSEAVRHFAGLGLDVVGIDNDMRQEFFGAEASTAWNVQQLTADLGTA